MDLGHEHQGLFTGQPVEQRQVLRDHANAALDRDRIGERIDAENAHRAAAGLEQPGQALDRGRFASAVGTQEAVEASGRNGEIDAVHGAKAAEESREPLGLDSEFHGRDSISAA